MNTFLKLFADLSVGVRAARYRRVLNELNDRQLADIGLARDAIGIRAAELARR